MNIREVITKLEEMEKQYGANTVVAVVLGLDETGRLQIEPVSDVSMMELIHGPVVTIA